MKVLFTLGLLISSAISVVLYANVNPSDFQYLSEFNGIKYAPIENNARSTVVRLFDFTANKKSGSGVLVKEIPSLEGYEYLVLTNAHVIGAEYKNSCFLAPSVRLKVETPDGRTHSSKLHPQSKELCEKADLALMYFRTDTIKYEVAKIEKNALSTELKGKDVYVSGFPCLEGCDKIGKLVVKKGTYKQLSKSFGHGYQIGYESAITTTGMSGGAVFNQKGILIGIHGKGSNSDLYEINPLSREDQKLVTENSWAIPSNLFFADISKLSSQVNSNSLLDKNLQQSNNSIHQSFDSLNSKLSKLNDKLLKIESQKIGINSLDKSLWIPLLLIFTISALSALFKFFIFAGSKYMRLLPNLRSCTTKLIKWARNKK
jgi:S1-C subfamily serine protease